MSIKLTWHGHATWRIDHGAETVIVDPFFTDNPACKVALASLTSVKMILVTHGHFDHIADGVALARQTGATVVSNYEISEWLAGKGVQHTVGMNLGGQTTVGTFRVKMTVAHHSSQLPDGSYGGNPGGYVVWIGGKTLYFAGDTALFGDMALVGRLGIDAAILPIGDLYTMGIDDSIEAVKLLTPKLVLPSHYNTWPPIAQDGQAWAQKINQQTSATPIVLDSGSSHTLD